MPVCCFGNKEQNIQQVQPMQAVQSPIVQPIVMPVMCPTQPTLVPYQQFANNPPSNIMQQPTLMPYQQFANNPQPSMNTGQNYSSGYSQQPPSSIGQNYSSEYSQNTIPGSVPPISININNSQDTNSKNTRNESKTTSPQMMNPVPMSINSPQPQQKTVTKHIIERKPVIITKNRVRTVTNTKTYYKMVRVPVEVEKNKYVYVNRFVPYNACEGATPHNVNNGFV